MNRKPFSFAHLLKYMYTVFRIWKEAAATTSLAGELNSHESRLLFGEVRIWTAI